MLIFPGGPFCAKLTNDVPNRVDQRVVQHSCSDEYALIMHLDGNHWLLCASSLKSFGLADLIYRPAWYLT
jgi:hypothetical protein